MCPTASSERLASLPIFFDYLMIGIKRLIFPSLSFTFPLKESEKMGGRLNLSIPESITIITDKRPKELVPGETAPSAQECLKFI